MDRKIELYVGNKIKIFRKQKKYTLEELAKKIYKSKSTLSKYENGEITIDISSLNDISEALEIPIKFFLDFSDTISLFPFSGENKIKENFEKYYVYFYDLRKKYYRKTDMVVSVLEVDSEKNATLYFLVQDVKNYKNCNYIYSGTKLIEGNSRKLVLVNSMSKSDIIVLNYLSYLKQNEESRSGSIISLSLGQFENYSTKCIISKIPLKIDENLIKSLLFSKEVIKDMKKTNTYRMDKV